MSDNSETELSIVDRRALQIIKLASEQAEDRRILIERCASIADYYSSEAAQAIRNQA